MPNTVRACAVGLRLWFEFLGQAGVGWADADMEDVARFGLYEKFVMGRRGTDEWK